MKCEVCGQSPSDGANLYRVNAKGVAGIWRCREHAKALDDEVVAIVEFLSSDPADIVEKPI